MRVMRALSAVAQIRRTAVRRSIGHYSTSWQADPLFQRWVFRRLLTGKRSTVQRPRASSNRGRFMKRSLVCLLTGLAVLSSALSGMIARAQQGDVPNGNAGALRFEVTSVKEAKTTPAPGELMGIHAMA